MVVRIYESDIEPNLGSILCAKEACQAKRQRSIVPSIPSPTLGKQDPKVRILPPVDDKSARDAAIAEPRAACGQSVPP